MTIHVKVAGGLLIAGLIAVVAYWLLEPGIEDARQRTASDASKLQGQIRVGMDNWIGYLPLCSYLMRNGLRQDGWALACDDDNADYPGRMARLARGEIQLAVATVDSYLLNGAAEGFPGVIIAVLDESKGGDAILARAQVAASLDDLKGMARPPRVAVTPRSPSEHLLNSVAAHFDVEALRDAGTRIDTEGSAAALALLLDGQADLAVLWEPDVTRALASPGIVKLMGSEDTRRLIVDILVAQRDLAEREPELVELVLKHYFLALKQLRDHPDALAREAREHAGLSPEQTRTVLGGVRWQGLIDNAQTWYGLGDPMQATDDGLVDAIEAAMAVLGGSDSQASALVDPYRLISSRFVRRLYEDGLDEASFRASAGATDAGGPDAGGPDAGGPRFAPLSEAQWGGLREVGTLRVRPIIFQSGTADLSFDGKVQLDQVAKSLAHYPNFRLRVVGHTGSRGDRQMNLRLSRERADAVARYLSVTHGLPAARMRALGMGSDQPLERRPGESSRAHQDRLRRVELTLMAESY